MRGRGDVYGVRTGLWKKKLRMGLGVLLEYHDTLDTSRDREGTSYFFSVDLSSEEVETRGQRRRRFAPTITDGAV